MTETGAIGIHDGFVIEASREEELRSVMKRAFAEEYDGYEIGVGREFEPLPSESGGTTGAHEPSEEQPSGSLGITPTPPKENRSIRPHPHNEQQKARREEQR
jgi:hypothetical protein